MLFNSPEFLAFFAIVSALYFALPYRFRWALLLAASCYFYMAFVPIYIVILGFTIVVDFIAAIWIESAPAARRKLFLLLSLIANVGVLAVFKYYNFFNDSLSFALRGLGAHSPLPYLSILLPIGLSFHTFQAMSYTIEVYRGRQKAERHFGIYSLYVMFYPQLVAGPIERPQNLLHQFREPHDFDYERVTSGLRLMVWGLFKKVVIADRLAIAVDHVYNNPKQFNSLGLLIATVFFAFQIFCDFSGYSDIAIGAARVMGFRLMTNFDKPYQSASVREFWTRWHISLSTWFKDYLYIPLGGNRVTIPRWYLNLFLVFVVSGLWHGASWTFVIWGALHGTYLLVSHASEPYRAAISRWLPLKRLPLLKVLATFALVDFAWIFFRANDVTSALYIAQHIFSGWPDVFRGMLSHKPALQPLGLNGRDMTLAVLLIGLVELVHYLQSRGPLELRFKARSIYLRWFCYLSGVFAILLFGVFDSRQFIYFQF